MCLSVCSKHCLYCTFHIKGTKLIWNEWVFFCILQLKIFLNWTSSEVKYLLWQKVVDEKKKNNINVSFWTQCNVAAILGPKQGNLKTPPSPYLSHVWTMSKFRQTFFLTSFLMKGLKNLTKMRHWISQCVSMRIVALIPKKIPNI